MPSRHPEFSGGVTILPSFTPKIFADVHSATSPRSLSITTSSKPSLAASATDQTLFSQEMVLTPASEDAAWRPWARSAKRTTSRYSRSEEHTSELQSRLHLVCRLLLEKKKHNQVHDASPSY